jgi:hypothetical protein
MQTGVVLLRAVTLVRIKIFHFTYLYLLQNKRGDLESLILGKKNLVTKTATKPERRSYHYTFFKHHMINSGKKNI